MKEDSDEGIKYAVGDDEMPTYGKILDSCGSCVGCCKAWCPCCGCICCCEDPYISVPQGSEGILTQYLKFYKDSVNSNTHANQDYTM